MSQPDCRVLLEDLYALRPAIYWSDLIVTSVLGWAAFAISSTRGLASPLGLLATVVAAFSLYRGLLFIHEISHHGQRLRGFEPAWNLLIGFPLLVPAFTYTGVHLDHHRLTTYGTKSDPEYLPLARSRLLSVACCVHALALPAALLLRFLLLAPLSLLFPKLEKWLLERASAITMNPQYRRAVDPAAVAKIRRDSVLLLMVWILALAFWWRGFIPGAALMLWAIVTVLINFFNGLRTLAAHRYESSGQPMDKMDQTADTIDVPGGIWTELWAPLGLRYHAIHHAFPSLPYHALPAAYRRLTAALPETYGRMTEPSLLHCLLTLFVREHRTG